MKQKILVTDLSDDQQMNHPIQQHAAPHFLLVPHSGCPARCGYCFGPRQGQTMSSDVFLQTLSYMQAVVSQWMTEKIQVTFHGGEPLSAGLSFFEFALEKLKNCFGLHRLQIKIQSNLWQLDEAFCSLFKKYHVGVGTSLDGPAEINDPQRGAGYFAKTLKGLEWARQYGLETGCIATLTNESIKHWRDIFDFFSEQRLSLTLHPAVPVLGMESSRFQLTPQAYVEQIPDMVATYLQRMKEIRISSWDQIVRGVCKGSGEVCTFRDCLGMFWAVDSEGFIYSCQRFCGHPEYRMGHVSQTPSRESLLSSPGAQRLKTLQHKVRENCGACQHWSYCRGGCLYNAAVAGNHDPYCEAYQCAFLTVKQHWIGAIQTPKGIHSLADGMNGKHDSGHMVFSLLDEKHHPSRTARHAKKVIAAVELGRNRTVQEIADQFISSGWSRNRAAVKASVEEMQAQLADPAVRLNNCYLHITNFCQLMCSHCYAGTTHRMDDSRMMTVGTVLDLVLQAAHAGFRQCVITGGEPLMHTDRLVLLDRLIGLRPEIGRMKLMLRSNFVAPMDDNALYQVSFAFDQIVISVDGDQGRHDARRGLGSYSATVANCRRYQELSRPESAKLSLAAVVAEPDERRAVVHELAELARSLGIVRTRVRPLLPLGRAGQLAIRPVSRTLHDEEDFIKILQDSAPIVTSCGLGQNLYIDPTGQVFPCYAHFSEKDCLGSVGKSGLAEILKQPGFIQCRHMHVDRNPTCRQCEYRYLCGGSCHAWAGDSHDCRGLKEKAGQLYQTALAYLVN